MSVALFFLEKIIEGKKERRGGEGKKERKRGEEKRRGKPKWRKDKIGTKIRTFMNPGDSRINDTSNFSKIEIELYNTSCANQGCQRGGLP